MQQFIDYLTTEYKDKATGYAAIDTKFTHSSTIKIDKFSKAYGRDPTGLVTLKNNIIKVGITFYDKSMNKLYSANISFENNMLPKSQAKKLINVSYKELENKFATAKNEICNVILRELIDKRNELNEKIDDITKYKGVDGVIPTEFKGESITITEGVEIPVKLKPKFDM